MISVSRFIILIWIFSFSRTIFLKGYLWFIVLSFLLCQKSVNVFMWVYQWSVYSFPLIYLSIFHQKHIFFLKHTVLITVALQWVLKLSNVSLSDLFLSAILGLLFLYLSFRNFVNIHKILCWEFDWYCRPGLKELTPYSSESSYSWAQNIPSLQLCDFVHKSFVTFFILLLLLFSH